jgi:Icc protein
MNRRTFVSLPAAALAAQASQVSSFRFVHFTDTHIQPELRAQAGTEQAFAAINAEKPDLILGGGDLVMDIDASTPARTKQLLDMYVAAKKGLQAPVYEVPGNHDVYGLHPTSAVSPRDPMYGKKMFEDRIGPRYRSIDHKGWHFILLDSIGAVGRKFFGEIDAAQVDWIKNDLAKVAPRTPIVVMTHIGLATAAASLIGNHEAPGSWEVFNSVEVLGLFAKHNLKAVLQGHSHIRENITYKGCQFITSGAVSGNWWKGLRDGHPEGFGLLTVKGDQIEWEYKTYGWKA